MFESVKTGGRGDVTAIVIGRFQDDAIPKSVLRTHDVGGILAAAAKRRESTGELGKLTEAFLPARKGAKETRALIVGLGKRDEFEPGRLREAAGAVGRRLAQTRDERVAIELAESLGKSRADRTLAGRCFGEGIGLLGWHFDEFRGRETPLSKRTNLRLHASDRAFAGGMKSGLLRAESANLARSLSQTPPNVATPLWMAAQARKLARKTGMTCRVLRGNQLQKERLAGLINVGKASENEPCLIRLEYRPRGRQGKAKRPVVLIGKTMTYDTGGLSLKSNTNMVGMKRDKDGGCAVLAVLHAVASWLRPSFPVVGLLAAAENCISDEAYRPDDVIRYRNGVTVEVTNTDAEGRLVLGDALAWACDVEKPSRIIDLATLTGGVVVALGSTYAGYFCEDATLREALEAASVTSGERIWRLPMHKDYREMMKSPIADIVNSNPNRKAHPIQGAAFLSYFVDRDIPWAHIDIAGVHESESDLGPFIKGPTGWGVRFLIDLLEKT